MDGYLLDQGEGTVAELGAISMRLLVSKSETDGAFAAAEFRGSEGSWTIPHIHRHLDESDRKSVV